MNWLLLLYEWTYIITPVYLQVSSSGCIGVRSWSIQLWSVHFWGDCVHRHCMLVVEQWCILMVGLQQLLLESVVGG